MKSLPFRLSVCVCVAGNVYTCSHHQHVKQYVSTLTHTPIHIRRCLLHVFVFVCAYIWIVQPILTITSVGDFGLFLFISSFETRVWSWRSSSSSPSLPAVLTSLPLVSSSSSSPQCDDLFEFYPLGRACTCVRVYTFQYSTVVFALVSQPA